MASGACDHGGTTARLRCVTCDTPICPRCMVETRVGFKCEEHGRMTAARVAGGAATVSAPPGRAARRALRAKAGAEPADRPGRPGRTGRAGKAKLDDPAAGPPPPPGGRRGGRPGMGGFGILAIVGMFVLFPLLTVGLGALFAVTSNSTGFVAALPLIAFLVALTAGTVVLARKLLR